MELLLNYGTEIWVQNADINGEIHTIEIELLVAYCMSILITDLIKRKVLKRDVTLYLIICQETLECLVSYCSVNCVQYSYLLVL